MGYGHYAEYRGRVELFIGDVSVHVVLMVIPLELFIEGVSYRSLDRIQECPRSAYGHTA